MKPKTWIKNGNKNPDFKLYIFYLAFFGWFDNWRGNFGDLSGKIVTDSLLEAREHGLGYDYGLMDYCILQQAMWGFLHFYSYL